jgi:hypothetical protein
VSDYPTYAIDDDTQELLETTMNLAQQIIDLQQDDETADAMQFELEELAERFNITRSRVVTTETVCEDGSVDVNIRLELEQDNKPKLTLIEGNKTDGNIYTLKPTDPLKP